MLSFERKDNATLVILLSNCPQVLKTFYDWPVIIIIVFSDFSIYDYWVI